MDIELLKSQIANDLKGKWLYWRWKGDKTWSKSYVYNVDNGMLEFTESNTWTKYPNRVLYSEIDYRETTA